MITCMGLIVGVVESTNRQDVLNQCAKFLRKYPHLQMIGLEFEIDNQMYARVYDIHDEADDFGVLYKMYDGCTCASFIG